MNLSAATRAVYAVFILSGFAFASWASRIPSVRDSLDLSPRSLGLVLLAMAVGSVIAMPLAGVVVGRLGTARTITVMALIGATGLALAGVGQSIGILPVVAGLFLFGAGNGTWDVAMNVEGSAVEQQLGKAIMPRFHAGFSVGTVTGALLGSGMVALGVSPAAHLIGVALVIAIAAPAAVRAFLGGTEEHEERVGNPLAAWTEPRTLLIGVFVFAAAFTEGTGNDWLAVATIDGYDAANALGTFTFALFLSAMTLGRWFGPAVLDRYGRVATLRVLSVTALVGLALVVFGGSLPVAMAGAVLWGLGTALGFPVGMSAASDEPAHAAARVSVVATVGYVAFLAGPPLIGFLADDVGTLRALTVTGGLVALGLLVSGALRAPAPMSSAAPGRLIPEPTERSS
ncbi:fucose permease [Solirubrobacter pauli]|uniref:Fucose permease n=1 Tax=Solirubrobacter pauli TaxID=166793 RepID=A0A660L1F0_9ACTN|nr:MFS transporter [Solirubrobacter pauli]RKQ87145.1 fucose permease [Solirubrobacter pauli]